MASWPLWARHQGAQLTRAGYVFVRAGNVYAQQAKLIASDAANNDNLGKSVSLSADGTRALVASPDVNVSTVLNAGAGYVFTFNPKANGQTCQITRECATRFRRRRVLLPDCGKRDDRDCQGLHRRQGASADGTCTAAQHHRLSHRGRSLRRHRVLHRQRHLSRRWPQEQHHVCRPAAGAQMLPSCAMAAASIVRRTSCAPPAMQTHRGPARSATPPTPATAAAKLPANFTAYGTDCGGGSIRSGTGRCI